MNLIIGNGSQLLPYFQEYDPKIPAISSRNIENYDFRGLEFNRVFLTFAEQRTFLNEPLDFFTKVNVDYTIEIIKRLAPQTKTFIVYATSELWNDYAGGITIDMPFKYTETPYIVSKEILTEKINELRETGLDIKIIYPFNFNSPYRKSGFLFSKFLDVILYDKKITVGDLNFERDIVHPKLIVEASLNTNTDVIVGSGKLINIREFYIDLLKYFSINYGDYVIEDNGSFINLRKPYFHNIKVRYNNLLEDTIYDIQKFKNSVS